MDSVILGILVVDMMFGPFHTVFSPFLTFINMHMYTGNRYVYMHIDKISQKSILKIIVYVVVSKLFLFLRCRRNCPKLKVRWSVIWGREKKRNKKGTEWQKSSLSCKIISVVHSACESICIRV